MAFDQAIAGYTIVCEASSETHEARQAVAWALCNRLARPERFGETLAEVCLERLQFSEWNGDRQDNSNLRRVARMADDSGIMLDALQALHEARAGLVLDMTGGATHYYDTSIAPPDWTAPPAEFTVQLGKLRFYRGVA